MAKAIILYNYNKYYNRIIKRLDTFAEYQALIVSHDNGITPPQYRGLLRENFNFDHNDGVHASKVVNIAKNEDTFFKTEHPDYMVIEEEYNAGTLEEPNITTKVSRWFILDLLKTRGGQFVFSLRRDLLADFFSEIMSAPAFIERGNPVVSDPALFNREGFTYNQIKKKELKLDFTKLSGKGGGWVVGYLARNDGNGQTTKITNATGHQPLPPDAEILDWTQMDTEIKNLITAGYGVKRNTLMSEIRFLFRVQFAKDKYIDYEGNIFEKNTADYDGDVYTNIWTETSNHIGNFYAFLKFQKNPNGNYFSANEALNKYLEIYNERHDQEKFNECLQDLLDNYLAQNNIIDFNQDYLTQYDNKYVLKDGQLYRIKVKKGPYEGINTSITKAQMLALSSALAYATSDFYGNIISGNNIIEDTSVAASREILKASCNFQSYKFELIDADFENIECSIPSTRNENLDAPYDLFCIPMGEVPVKKNGTTEFITIIDSALAMARGIAIKGTTSIVYDVQILPYCPYPEMLDSEGNIDISAYDLDEDYTYIKKNVEGNLTNIGIILFPKSCRGTFDLTIPTTFDGFTEYCAEETMYPMEKKVKTETHVARFVSPNFSAMFDFNPQKNNGLAELNVDYFYKPYSPYIHVAPYFKGLYGGEFDDPKGLICTGDFSISTAQSQWEQYQIQNKNYEIIFDRQIQNLDINNSIAYEQQRMTGTLGAISTAIQGASAGAMTGAMTGNPFVAAAGAVVGGFSAGITSAIGAQKDLEFLSRSQQEARDYSIDMYTYNLGNIKALPNTLTKVSSLTENNKIFPFIEFYDCTEEEKEALRNKIRYNGMTIMRIGTIADFIDGDNNYVQAQLIRLLGLTEDNHVVSEIAKEIKMGAYYYGTNTISS